MAKKDVIEFEGTVVENLPNAMFKVKEMLIFECFLEIKRQIKVVQVGR